jgi:hypothetical protein
MAGSTNSKKDQEVIQEALKTLQELEKLYDSENIIYIGQLCNRLASLTVNLGKQVSDARKLFKELESTYDNNVEKKKLELIESGMGVGKAESVSEVENFDGLKDSLTAEDGFERLKRFLDRCDKVLDAYKQYTSTIKNTNLKHI